MMKLTVPHFPLVMSFDVLPCLATKIVGAALESAVRSRVAKRVDFITMCIFELRHDQRDSEQEY
jgi:hypothetical protein